MPVILLALVSVLGQAASTLVGRVLLALGFQYVIYTGVSASIDWAMDAAMNNLSGFNGTVLAIVAITNIDDAIAIIGAAVAVKMTLAGLTNGTITKMVLK